MFQFHLRSRTGLVGLSLSKMRFIKASSAIFASCSLFAAFSGAEMNNNQDASIALRWRDAAGKNFKITGNEVHPKLEKMAWVWSTAKGASGKEVPALRVWIRTELPEGWKIVKAQPTGADLAKGEEARMESVVIDVRSTDSTVKYRFATGSNKTVDLGLNIKVAVTQPYVLMKPECHSEGINLVSSRTSSKNLYVGFECIKTSNGVVVTSIRSLDSKWGSKATRWTRNAVIAQTTVRTGDSLELSVLDRAGAISTFSVYVNQNADMHKVAERREEKATEVSSVSKGIWKRFHLKRAQAYGLFAFQTKPFRDSHFMGGRYTPLIDVLPMLSIQPWVGAFGMHGSDSENYPVLDYGTVLQLHNLVGPLVFDMGGGGVTSFQSGTELEIMPMVSFGFEYKFQNRIFGVLDRAVLMGHYVFRGEDTLLINYGMTFAF